MILLLDCLIFAVLQSFDMSGFTDAIVKRKLNVNNLGQLTKRRSGTNVKDNLVKNVYNLYSFGEGSLHSLPKSMFKAELKFCHQEIQTDSCLSQTLFASNQMLIM